MKSMKFSKAERPSEDIMYSEAGAEFPYGLKITLEPRVLEKLDLGKLPQVGQVMGLNAVVEVTEVRADKSMSGGRNKSLCLQITDMELKSRPKNAPQETAKAEENPQPKTTYLGG